MLDDPLTPHRRAALVLVCALLVGGVVAIALVAFLRSDPSAPARSASSPAEDGDTEVLVGAGDIANCNTSTDSATADLLDSIPGTVFTLGDNVYSDGTSAEFARCYEPTWGRHRDRTRPAPGNHDYHVKGAAGYFEYFGAAAGPPGAGYYAYDLGAWRVYSLNSQVVSSAQLDWLEADLAANPSECIVAYWHHPRWATEDANGSHGPQEKSEPLWAAMVDAGADLVLNGHSHHYERLAPIDGITTVIVGTGGTKMDGFGTPIPESVVRHSDTHGVLELSLDPDGYEARFVPIRDGAFTDTFRGAC